MRTGPLGSREMTSLHGVPQACATQSLAGVLPQDLPPFQSITSVTRAFVLLLLLSVPCARSCANDRGCGRLGDSQGGSWGDVR